MSDERKIIAVIKRAMPAVVSVIIEKKLQDLQKEMPHELYSFLPGKEHGQKFPTKLPKFLADSDGMVTVGNGSGFIVQSGGLILTNRHVVSDKNAQYVVILNDGRKLPAEILSRDPINDIAILKIKASKLPTLKLGNAARLELGQSVIAIGNALGLFRNTVSVGIISGLSRSISAKEDDKSPSQELRGLIQTDAAINVGNSGGPLVDLNGRVVGINAAIISGAQSIGFAIPVKAAERDLADLRKFGRIRTAYLGLRYIVLEEHMQIKMKTPVAYGAYVISESPHDPGVTPGSPAAEARLKDKDIVLEFSGKKVDTDHPIQDYLENKEPGDEAELLVLREGHRFRVKVILAE